MCFFLILLAFSPRIAAVFWWIFRPERWDSSFGSWIWPVLGIAFAPWTTIMWVSVAPFGNLSGADWVWIGMGFLLDTMSYASGGYGGRRRYSSSAY